MSSDDLVWDANILDEISNERERQQTKWGEQDHTPTEWMVILGEEYGEVCREVWEWQINKDGDEHLIAMRSYRAELIQVAAVAVAAIRNLDRTI